MKKQNRPLEVDPNDSTQFLRDEAMYLGFKVMKKMNKPEIYSNKQMLKDFFTRCRQFLIVSCNQIKKR